MRLVIIIKVVGNSCKIELRMVMNHPEHILKPDNIRECFEIHAALFFKDPVDMLSGIGCLFCKFAGSQQPFP